jgi:hypothetical protein
MTYLPERSGTSPKVNIYYNATGAVSVGTAISWSTKGSTGHDFTMTQSGATFTVPNDGHVYIFEAALAPDTPNNVSTSYGVSFRWYDDGGASGNIATGQTMINDAEVKMGFWADERARCYVKATSASHSVQLKITAVHGTAPGAVDGGPSYSWDANARVLVWRL